MPYEISKLVNGVERHARSEYLQHVFVSLIFIDKFHHPIFIVNLLRHLHFENSVSTYHEPANCHLTPRSRVLSKHHKNHEYEWGKTARALNGIGVFTEVWNVLTQFFDEILFFVKHIVLVIRFL